MIKFTYFVDEIEKVSSLLVISIGEKVANREIMRLEYISELDISRSTKMRMIASEKR